MIWFTLLEMSQLLRVKDLPTFFRLSALMRYFVTPAFSPDTTKFGTVTPFMSREQRISGSILFMLYAANTRTIDLSGCCTYSGGVSEDVCVYVPSLDHAVIHIPWKTETIKSKNIAYIIFKYSVS